MLTNVTQLQKIQDWEESTETGETINIDLRQLHVYTLHKVTALGFVEIVKKVERNSLILCSICTTDLQCM